MHALARRPGAGRGDALSNLFSQRHLCQIAHRALTLPRTMLAGTPQKNNPTPCSHRTKSDLRENARMIDSCLKGTLALGVALMAPGAASAQSVNVTTHHYDNLRTGWDQGETVLTPTAVGGGSFQLQHQVTLDEQVDAQPLLVTNQTINGGVHNVLYVATENNSIYALDAATGAVLVQKNYGAPVPLSALPGGCSNNSSNVGIGGTPVIDTAARTLYAITYTYENNAPVYRIHAIDIVTLADKVSPLVISASASLTNGKTYSFTPGSSRQRAALLLANGNVYAAFASFCDLNANTSRGWVLGWNTGSLTPLAANKLTDTRGTSPDGFFLTSIWMSGAGLAASTAGDIYFVTGNSDPNGKEYNSKTNVAESAVQLSSDLTTVEGIFTPTGPTYGHPVLDENDDDFGSGGIMLLPPQSVSSTNLALAAGKDGLMYLLNADNLTNNAAAVTGTALTQVSVGGCWCAQTYFTGDDGFGRVVSSGGFNAVVWKLEGGAKLRLVKLATSGTVANGQNPGFFTTVSSNGTSTGSVVIWAVGRPVNSSPAHVQLYAFSEQGSQLFAGVAGTWPNSGATSNIVPVVANGQVYVASYKNLSIFGLGSAAVAAVPATHAKAARAALPAGQHEIYGTVQAIDGSTIVIVKRSGEFAKVDAAAAFAKFLAVAPSVGRAVLVRGAVDEGGVMHAETMQRAQDNPELWQPDR